MACWKALVENFAEDVVWKTPRECYNGLTDLHLTDETFVLLPQGLESMFQVNQLMLDRPNSLDWMKQKGLYFLYLWVGWDVVRTKLSFEREIVD